MIVQATEKGRVHEQGLHVTVTFLRLLRDQGGVSRLELTLPPGARARDLLNALAPHVEGRLSDWAWDSAKRGFTPRVAMSLGQSLKDVDGILADGQEIVVFSPMAGG